MSCMFPFVSRHVVTHDVLVSKPGELRSLPDEAEAHFAAGSWELLVHLHRTGWQIMLCRRERSAGYFSIEGDRSHRVCVCVREQGEKRRHICKIPRAYLVLLSTAELIGFKHEIRHLGKVELYNAFLMLLSRTMPNR